MNGRPTVDQVALLIRARTKDDAGNEVGTFDDATRPTEAQVEAHIDAAAAIVGLRTPPVADLPEDLLPAVEATVALEAACQIEKSYWPEQVVSGKSPYDQLRAEADAALAALEKTASAAIGGGDEYRFGQFAAIPVKSWTSLWPFCEETWPPV